MPISLEAEDFTPTPSSAEYQPVIDFAIAQEGTGKVASFTIPTDDVAKTERVLRELAVKKERSVRFDKSGEAPEGSTRMRVWTVPQVKRPRKPKTEAEATPEAADVKSAAKK